MSSVTYMHGRTETYDELRKPVSEYDAQLARGQAIDDAIDLWIAGKGPAPALVSDPDYTGPRALEGYTGKPYTYSYRESKGYEGIRPLYGDNIKVTMPGCEAVDAFAGITRTEYAAYVSRVKVSRTGVVTAVKVRKTAARKTAAKSCPHCGGAL
jgi:hypothetical protein